MSQIPTLYGIPTFNAIADEEPDGVVMDGAENGVQPKVGERNALSNKLSDPLLISGTVSDGYDQDLRTYLLNSYCLPHSLSYSVQEQFRL